MKFVFKRMKWWIEDKLVWGDYKRWDKLVKKCKKLPTPQTHDEYKKVHKMFIKTSKKCNDWCYAVGAFRDVYSKKIIAQFKDKSIKDVYDAFIDRMDYFSDRMGWERWLELTAYLGMMDDLISEGEIIS